MWQQRASGGVAAVPRQSTSPARGAPMLPAVAWRPVLLVAAAVGAALLATSWRYGYYGDELYFIAAGNHPAAGYVDQPPLVPLLAAGLDLLFPGSLIALRLPATLATAALPVLAALIAREFGGARRGQVLAAAVTGVSPMLLYMGHILFPVTLDAVCWTAVTWLLVRWVRTRREWLLVAAGAVTAVALQLDYLVAGFWIVLAAVLLLRGGHPLLRRWGIWVGMAIAVASAVPTLVWQANHGWPQLAMARLISDGNELLGGRPLLLPNILLRAGLVAGVPLLCYGLWQLLRSRELAPYRFLGFTVLGLTVLMVAVDGTYYYLNGLFVLCWAAGATAATRRRPAAWWRWTHAWPALAVSAVVAVAYALPVYPVDVATKVGRRVTYAIDTIGWSHLADQVAAVERSLPASRAPTAVVTEGYVQAAALAHYGPDRGLPTAYSPDRGYYYFGHPRGDAPVLYVGVNEEYLRAHFATVRRVGTTDARYGPYDTSTGVPLWYCTGPRGGWNALWPALRTLHLQ